MKEVEEEFYYPSEDYFDFSEGIVVSDFEIQRWINECLTEIREKIDKEPDRQEFFHIISSGNTQVLVEAYRERKDKFSVYVTVNNVYKTNHKTNLKF